MGISATFSDIFFHGGSAIAEDIPTRLPVAIAGHAYAIDTARYQRESLDVIRQQADQSNEPSERSFNPFALWRRSIESWHYGAGQVSFDLADESDPRRFRSSKGIDVWTQGVIGLLLDVDEKLDSANANLFLAVAGARLYALDGQALKFATDIGPDTPSFTSVTGTPAETPTSITTDGFRVWAAYPSGPWLTDTGISTAAAFGTQDVDLLAYANGRLFASHDDVLYELDAAGAPTTIYDHPTSAFRWDVIASTPNAVYAAGHAGTHGEVYRVSFADQADTTASVVAAIALPDGEYVTAILAYVGIIVLGTNRGVRLASTDGDGGLNYGPLIPTTAAVACLEGEDRFVWFGWTDYDGSSTGLGRLDLSVFTGPLRPAYASDLMVGGQGAVVSVVTFGGLRVLGVAADGIYAEDTDKVASGSVDSGVIRWGTTERKTVYSVDIRTEPIPDGASVGLALAFDDPEFENISTLEGGTGPPVPFAAHHGRTEQTELRLTLNRAADPIAGPVVLRSTLHALVTPARAEAIVVPILLADMIDDDSGDGETLACDPSAEFDFLKSLEADGTPVTYQEGAKSWIVTVEKVAFEARSWSKDRRWLNGTCLVTLRTIS